MSGEHAGQIVAIPGSGTQLRYDPGYAGTPLSLSLPVGREPRPGRLWTYLENLLPENPQTLEVWARAYQIPDVGNPLDVIEAVGSDLPGAVQILPEGLAPSTTATRARLTDDSLDEMLEELRFRGGTATGARVSLAGAQAKTALGRDLDGWYIPQGAEPSTHILKPAPVRELTFAAVESSLLGAARRIGLPTSTTWVHSASGGPVLVTERYDRIGGADGVRRVHQEDLLQALGRTRDRKYQKDHGPALRDLWRFVAAHAPQDVARVVRLTAFNVLVGNTDAHAKNFSFLLSPTEVRLAPAYDLLSVAPYPRYDQRLAMSVGGNWDWRNTQRAHWTKAATQAGLDSELVLEQVREVAAALPDALRDAGAPKSVLSAASATSAQALDRL